MRQVHEMLTEERMKEEVRRKGRQNRTWSLKEKRRTTSQLPQQMSAQEANSGTQMQLEPFDEPVRHVCEVVLFQSGKGGDAQA